MPTRLPKAGSDVNVWITGNNYEYSRNENIDIVLNGNNPPTIKQYTRFYFYNTDTHTPSAGTPTGNNEYGQADTLTYLVNEAIFEDSADVTFTWGGSVRGETMPSQSDGTWYIYSSGSYDLNETTIGQGTYNVSKTETPTWSTIFDGWYSSNSNKIIGSFDSTGGTVSDLKIYSKEVFRAGGIPDVAPVKIGQKYIDTTNGYRYIATGTSAVSDWHLEYAYGTTTVTGGGGDVTISLGGNWVNGSIICYVSDTANEYMTNTDDDTIKVESTYDSLTDASYTAVNSIRYYARSNTTTSIQNNFSMPIKASNFTGNINAVTSTSFTLNDDGSNTRYIKWVIRG